MSNGLDEAAFTYACSEAIDLMRQLRPRVWNGEEGLSDEFVRKIMPLFAAAGATLDEAQECVNHIILAVFAEARP